MSNAPTHDKTQHDTKPPAVTTGGPQPAAPETANEASSGAVRDVFLGGGRPNPNNVPAALGWMDSAMLADTVEQLQVNQGNHYVQRLVNPIIQPRVQREPKRPPVAPGKTQPPDAAALVASQYGQIKLPADVLETLQKVFDARARIEDVNKEIAPIANSYLSEDVQKREALMANKATDERYVQSNSQLSVPSEHIMSGDILSKDEKDKPSEIAFREALYKQMLSINTALVIGAGLNPSPLFTFQWGPGRWVLTQDGGKVHFNDLLKIQKINISWQKILVGEQVKLLEEMAELTRESGVPYNQEGKKLGEIWGYIWNTTVKVGPEMGKIGGYYNDARGQKELDDDFRKAKGAKVVLLAPDNFLHFFAVSPSFNSYDLTSADKAINGDAKDGFVYMLGKGAAVSANRLITADGRELEAAGGSWRTKQDVNDYEQFAIGAILGDAVDDPSTAMMLGQIVIGVIPIVGQIADARDVAIGIHKIYASGGKDGKLQTALALVGFIPFGDLIKLAKGGGKKAAVEAAQKAIKEGAPAAEKKLARALVEDAKGVAKLFPNLSVAEREALKSLPEAASKALKEGGQAATDFAEQMSKLMKDSGGHAGGLVSLSGGKWATVAKALAADASGVGAQVGKEMQAWRKAQFGALDSKVVNAIGDLGPEVKAMEPPKSVITGTDSVISDVDISFMGPNATTHRNAAIRQMEEQYGKGWRDLLDADIFADPTRLHMFDTLDPKLAKGVEKKMVKEAELNALAKMANDGADMKTIEELAKKMGANMDDVAKRTKELKELAGNKELYQQLEMKMDVLHDRFLKETDPAARAAIAEEMAMTQGKLNAAVQGPYMTPGGARKHVTGREAAMRPGAFKAMSPAMGYMALVDDLYMLQHVMQGVGKEGFSASSAKSMAKYADRLLISAGQHGIDMAKAKQARALFDTIDGLLAGSRKNPKKVLEQAAGHLEAAKGALNGQLGDLLTAVKKNADDYLAEAGQAAERGSVMDMVTKSQDTIRRELAIIGRLIIRTDEAEDAEPATPGGVQRMAADRTAPVQRGVQRAPAVQRDARKPKAAEQTVSPTTPQTRVQRKPVEPAEPNDAKPVREEAPLITPVPEDGAPVERRASLAPAAPVTPSLPQEAVQRTPAVQRSVTPAVLSPAGGIAATSASPESTRSGAGQDSSPQGGIVAPQAGVAAEGPKTETPKSGPPKSGPPKPETPDTMQSRAQPEFAVQRTTKPDAQALSPDAVQGHVQNALAVQRQTLVQREDPPVPAPAPAVTPVPAPGSDKAPDPPKGTFKGSFQSFAPNFDLTYTPGTPAPAVGKAEVTLHVLIEYKDFDKDVAKEEPFKSYFRRKPLTAAQKADFAWSVKEKEEIGKKFQADFKAQVSSAWGGKHQFRLKEPDFAEYIASVAINVVTTENPGDKFHNKVAVQKVPKGIDARYRSNVRRGDHESTLDYRDADPAKNEKHKNEAHTHEYVRQIKAFGFDSAELTPDLQAQVDGMAADLKKRQDPAKTDTLLGEKYAVNLTGRASSKGDKGYNQKLGQRRAVAVEQRLAADLGRPGVHSRANSVGEEHASEDEKFQRVDVMVWNVEKAFAGPDPEIEQNVAAHEAGHMFGLDDEYTDEKPEKGKPKFLGDEPDHYDKVKELMGEEAAREVVMDRSSNIMSTGMDVKRGHYVMFLEALNGVTGKKWSVE